MIITIDGPVASGKSTIGKLLAKHLGAYYLYTGLLYRALAYLLMHRFNYALTTIDNPDLKVVAELVDSRYFVYHYDAHQGERVLFDGIDITDSLRCAIIDQAASILSTNTQVRFALNILQKKIALGKTIVIDGRDAGSVVFAHAEFKFFLTADPRERAERWQAQQAARGNNISLEQALVSLHTRDTRDSARVSAPLIIPQGAVVIDTTGMICEQVLRRMMEHMYSHPEQSYQHLMK